MCKAVHFCSCALQLENPHCVPFWSCRLALTRMNTLTQDISPMQTSSNATAVMFTFGGFQAKGNSSTGNQEAHTTHRIARISPLLTPAVEASFTSTSPPPLLHMWHKKNCLKAVIPKGNLATLLPLPRSGKRFISQFLINAAYTPKTLG